MIYYYRLATMMPSNLPIPPPTLLRTAGVSSSLEKALGSAYLVPLSQNIATISAHRYAKATQANLLSLHFSWRFGILQPHPKMFTELEELTKECFTK